MTEPRKSIIVPAILSGMVLLFSLGMTLVFWRMELVSAQKDLRTDFEYQVRDTVSRIESRMAACEQVLRGAQGLFAASGMVSRKDFRVYVEALGLQSHYPGIQGVGYIVVVSPSRKADHLATVRADGYPDYDIWPAGERDVYTSVIYLEPFTGRNLRAFGYDTNTEPLRRAAMQASRDSGESRLTAKIRLVQEGDEAVQAGCLMFLPVYGKNSSALTLSDRQANIVGWVYSPFRMDDLMAGILGQHTSEIDLKIYDGDKPTPQALMYDSRGARSDGPTLAHPIKSVHKLKISGHRWTLEMAARPAFAGRMDKGLATLVLATGTLLALALAFLTWMLTTSRARALDLAAEMTQELRQSEERWKFALEGAGDGVWDWEVQSGQVLYSKRWKEMIGYGEDEIGSGFQEWETRVHPEDMPGVMKSLEAYFSGEAPIYAIEHRMLCKDGGWKWILARGMAVSRTPDGQPARMIGTHADISEMKQAQEKVEQSEIRFRTLFEHAGEAIFLLTSEGPDRGRIEEINVAGAKIYGYERAEMLGMNIAELTSSGGAEQGELPLEQVTESEPVHGEAEHRRKDGERFPVEFNASLMCVIDRNYLLVFVRDISARKQGEAQFKLASTVFDNTVEGILITDSEGTVMMVNPAFSEISGFQPEEVVGNSPLILRGENLPAELYESIWDGLIKDGQWRGEIWNRRKNGEAYPEWVTIKTIVDNKGNTTNYIAIIHDITEIKRGEERIKHQAYHDALTGLPNRQLFNDRLGQAMAHADREGGRLAVFFLDLDHFKRINDSLGHHTGDLLLQESARRLKECLRESDTVSRLGGDEFTLLLPEVGKVEEALEVANRILNTLSTPYLIQGQELFITTSMGITIYPDDAKNSESLLKNADLAMYRAKERGRNNFQLFTTAMNTEAQLRLQLESQLREALAQDQFMNYYQAKVKVDSGEVVGMEALVRWQRPGQGLITPGTFIALAEDTGLILPLGELVLRRACQETQAWRLAGNPHLCVSVNLSPRQFEQENLVDMVEEILSQTGLPAANLELEITEGSIMRNVEAALAKLLSLSGMGVKLSLDDFGTGYSSLSHLKRFPISALKIDQSFVRDIVSDPNDAAIVETIIAMGHALGLLVVAEGVENDEQLAFLHDHGCDQCQGYYFSRPVPAMDFEALLPSANPGA